MYVENIYVDTARIYLFSVWFLGEPTRSFFFFFFFFFLFQKFK